jgi:hypothetical protein
MALADVAVASAATRVKAAIMAERRILESLLFQS